MAPETTLAGTVLAGRYVFERELGRGGEGRVLQVRADDTGEPRALKLVAPEAEERVRTEFALLSRVSHPNLAAVVELLRIDEGVNALRVPRGALALVSELAPGLPADRALRRVTTSGGAAAPSMPARQLRFSLRVLERAARALAAVHAQGFVHGDVKAGNLIVSEDASALKLIDLGLARAPGFESQPSGTPHHMAPELFRGELSPAADVYALGVCVWRLLSPQPRAVLPANAAELLSRALADPELAEPLPGWVPPGLRELLAAMRAADRSRRPSGARELLEELARLAAALPAELASELSAEAGEARTAKERALAIGALPVVGQSRAREALEGALARGGAVVVMGPLGAGRSRLVREAVFALQLARSHEAGPLPAYRAVDGLPARLAPGPEVVHVLDAEAVSAAEVRRFVLATGLELQPSVLVLERTRPLDDPEIPEVRVGPLEQAELARLLALGLGASPRPELIDDAAAVSGGLAARLCRLLAAALLAGEEPARPGQLRGYAAASGPLPALTPAARRLAECLSVAGGTLSVARAPACSSDARELAEAAQLLCTLGLASDAGAGGLRLRPDVSQLLWDELGPARRAELARSIPPLGSQGAAALRCDAFLAAARAEAGAAAVAFARAAQRRLETGDPALALELTREAERALAPAALDPELVRCRADALRALGRYAEALAAVDAGPAPGPELGVLRAEVSRLQGDSTSAESFARAARDAAPDAPIAGRAGALLARLALDAGQAQAAEQIAREVSQRAGDEPYGLRAAEVLALALLAQDRGDEARAVLEPALVAARARGERAAEARLCSVQGSQKQRAGQLRGAARSFARAFELADATGEYHAAASFLVNLGTAQLDAGELGVALETLREGARRLARLGRERDVARCLYNLALARQLVGDYADAQRLAGRAFHLSRLAGDPATAAYAAVACAEIAHAQGEPASARTWLAEVAAPSLPGAQSVAVFARAASVSAALGDQAAAREHLSRAEAAAEGAEPPDVELRLARAACFALGGDVVGAQREAEWALAGARERGEHALSLLALLAAARAAEQRGDAALARARLSELRAQLDATALTLSSTDRARLRDVQAYRAALAALPAGGDAARERTERAVQARPGEVRFRQLTAIAKRLAAESRPRRLYDLILDAAVELTQAESGYLLLREEDGELRVRAGRGIGERDQTAAGISHSIVARVSSSGQALSTVDASRDARLLGASSVHALALRSVLVVPLRRGAEISGVIYLDDRLRPFAFGDDEVALLSDLAELAAIALEAAERLRRERRAMRRLRATQAELARRVEAQAIELAAWKGSDQLAFEQTGIVAHSPAMRHTLELALRVARSDVPVLIRGESGTGKELIAKAIHAASARKAAPFVSENCGAIPESLLESTLFGHVKGAFTGADRRHRGLFEAAHGGTLFLDEIGEMTPAMQVRLLRVLQDGEVRPVGGERATRVDVRVVCATHRDIEAMLERGAFREDLFYRLAVVSLGLPPLRERSEDVLPLVQHFLAKYAPDRKLKIDRRTLERLASFAWPGNVRQLENELRRALALSGGEHLREEHFSVLASRGSPRTAVGELDLRARVDELERELIRRALELTRGNQTRAAELLGVSRFGLQKMLKRLAVSSRDG